MKFKEYLYLLNEGRNAWHLFTIKKGSLNKKWSFRNKYTNKINYIKIEPNNELGSMQSFLKDIQATPGHLPKTKGDIDFHKFASDVISGKIYSVYVKTGTQPKIKQTWSLTNEI